MSLRDVFIRSHGKALEKEDGESEDRPETNVVPILGVRGKVLLIRPVICSYALRYEFRIGPSSVLTPSLDRRTVL